MDRTSFRTYKAFTVVELLITVVVVAILAAVVVVAYNGITNQGRDVALKSDLRAAAADLGRTKAKDGAYPVSFAPKNSADNLLTYIGGGEEFCITASNPQSPGRSFRITQNDSIEEGACTAAPLATMQSFTSSQCQALPVYLGSNTTALRRLVDNRGAAQVYTVGKLADNKCWMLDNLKLGSATSITVLTPSNSNVTANFTLPQLTSDSRARDLSTNPGNDYDTPYVTGPIAGDTGSGATNYGYLYNFSAATAGATRTSLSGDTTAPSSICPAGWRLPGGNSNLTNHFRDLDIALGGTGSYTGSYSQSVSQWQFSGPFRGVFSGVKNDTLASQGSSGILWSSSATSTGAMYAHRASFSASSTEPGSGSATYGRGTGLAVRCIVL